MTQPYSTTFSYNSVSQFLNTSLCSGSFDNVPQPVIQSYLCVARSEIDGALRTNHTPVGNGQFFAPGEVPGIVIYAEMVIAAYRLLQSQGLNPGGQKAFIQQEFTRIYGDPDGVNPASGFLGGLRYNKIHLVDDTDNEPTVAAPAPLQVYGGSAPRGWNQRGPWGFPGNGRDTI
jgi:hypothetical protein